MSETAKVKAHLWTRNFILLSLANFLMFTAFYFLIPILPVYITAELGGNKSLVGVILATYTLAALIMRPLTGVAVDTVGRRMIFLVGMIIFTLMFNLYILASSIMLLLILRFIHGLAWGVTNTAGNTLVVDIIPPSRRGEGIGIYGLSFTIAMAIGPLLAILILQGSHYKLVFFCGFLMSLLGWLLATSVKYPVYLPLNGGKMKLKRLLEKRAVPVSVNLLILNVTYGGIITFIALYAKEVGVPNPGMFFLLYAIGVSFSRAGAGRIFDRHGPDYLVGVGSLILAFGFVLISLWKTVPGFYIASLLLGFGGGVIMPTFQAMVNNLIEPQRRGAANSTLFTALDLGIGTGMILTGLIAEVLSLTSAFLICSFIILAGLVVYLTWAGPHYKKHQIHLI